MKKNWFTFSILFLFLLSCFVSLNVKAASPPPQYAGTATTIGGACVCGGNDCSPCCFK